jgi:hypothetical protein
MDWRWFLLLLIAASFTSKVAYILLFTQPQEYLCCDMSVYDNHAMNILNGEKMWEPTLWSPAYQLFLAAVYYVFKFFGLFDYRRLLVPVLNCLMSSVTVFFVYRITEKLSNSRSAMLAAAIYAFFYPITYLNIFLLSENLFIPLFLAFIYVAVCKLDGGISGPVSGLLLGAAVVVRPTPLLFAPFYFVWYAYYFRQYRQVILSAGVFLLILLMSAAYNYTLTEGKVLSLTTTNGGVVFALSWCDLKGIRYDIPGWAGEIYPPVNGNYVDKTLVRTDVGFLNQSYYYQMGLECIEKDPLVLLWNFKQIGRLFDSVLFPRWDSVTWYRCFITFSKIFTYFVLLPFSMMSYWYVSRKNRKYLYLLAALILTLFVVVYAQSVGEERYLIPYEIIFIILGGIMPRLRGYTPQSART